jgi:hypothetical protein
MNTQAQDADSTPALIPEGGEVVSDNTSFVTACLLEATKLPVSSGWELGLPVLTRSEKWGEICRVDFRIKDTNLAPLVNRIMCWRNADDGLSIMYAIGQRIPGLKPPQ